MSFPRLVCAFRLAVRHSSAVLLIAAVPLPLAAQQSAPAAPSQSTPAAPQPEQPRAVNLIDYSQPRSAFPHVLQPEERQRNAALPT